VYYVDPADVGGGGTPGGSTTQIQYNNSGAFAGSSDLTWDGTGLNLASTKRLVLNDDKNDYLTCNTNHYMSFFTTGVEQFQVANTLTKSNNDFSPYTDATFDLGSASLQWADAHLSGVVQIGDGSGYGSSVAIQFGNDNSMIYESEDGILEVDATRVDVNAGLDVDDEINMDGYKTIITADFDMDALADNDNHTFYYVDPTDANLDITLTAYSGSTDRVYYISNLDASYAITIGVQSSDKINTSTDGTVSVPAETTVVVHNTGISTIGWFCNAALIP